MNLIGDYPVRMRSRTEAMNHVTSLRGGTWVCLVSVVRSDTLFMVYPFVSAPECRDIETALYDRTSVFSELCSIFQYVIKRWLRALQLQCSKQREYIFGNFDFSC